MEQVDFYYVNGEGQRLFSDVMIVDCGGRYYVATKIKDAVVYKKLLVERQKTGTYFKEYDKARAYAEMLSQRITEQQGVQCDIKEYDLLQFLSGATKGERPYKYFVYRDVKYPYTVISEKGKEVFEYIFEEEKYQYVDKVKYAQIIQDNIAVDPSDDFYLMGLNKGFTYALYTSLPYLYREIYLVSRFLDEEDKDDELYKNNYLYYSGYIDAVIKAVQIQKECILTEGDFEIILLDYDGSGILEYNQDKMFSILPEGVKLDVVVFNDKNKFLDYCLSTTKRNLFAVISPKSSRNSWDRERFSIEEKIGLIPQYFYDQTSWRPLKKVLMTTAIKHCLKNLMFLSNNGTSISGKVDDEEK